MSRYCITCVQKLSGSQLNLSHETFNTYCGDLLLAGTAYGRLLGQCAGLCLQAMGGDLNNRLAAQFQ